MGRTTFQKILIIGYGRIAAQVLEYVCGKSGEYGYVTEFVEHEIQPFGILKKICEERQVPFLSVPERRRLAEELSKIREETLIISASNNFLFPPDVVAKENVTIVNFHNALLPRFPGRNAPSWVIYEGERETGITWHYVTAGVDEGSIILQKRCAIEPDMKAYELAEKLMTLALEGFCECFGETLEKSAPARPQQMPPHRRMYRSGEIPGGGHFDTQDSPADIYRLLRAVDYGKNNIFPEVTATHEGREIRILRYKKVSRETAARGEGLLYLPLDEDNVLKLKYGVCGG